MKKNGLAGLPGNWILQRSILIFKLTTIICFVSFLQVSAENDFKGTETTFSEREKIGTGKLQNSSTPEKELTGVDSNSSQQKVVSGKVTDTTGGTMPGVSVVVKGSTLGVITDANGAYSLANVPANATLQFSFVGMKSKEVVVANNTTINVTLEEETIGIEEVVAIGYGTAKKKDLTGAVASMKPEKIENEKPQNLQDILRGNVAGLEVSASNSAKGGGAFEIRGDNTLKTASSPLIVVDGVIYPGSTSDINPFDIASIDVLKDASSSAVFGAHAANGVIVITTKKGIEGKPKINFTSSLGIATLAKMPEVYDAEGFIPWRQDVLRSLNYYNPTGKDKLYIFDDPNNLPPGVTMDMWRDNKTGDPTDIWLARLGFLSMEVKNYKEGNPTDWGDMVFQNGLRQDYNLSLSGKKDDVTYFWSLGYNNNEGFIVGDQFLTFRSRLNLDAKVTDWLSVGLNTQFSNRDESAIPAEWNLIWRDPPYGSVYTDDGLKLRRSPTDNAGSTVINPIYDRSFQTRKRNERNLISTLYANVKLPFGITYQANFSTRYADYAYFNHESALHEDWSKIGGRATRERNTIYSWQLDNLFKWNKIINQVHKIDATFLINAEKYQNWSESMTIQGFDPTDALGYHAMQAGTSASSSIRSNDEYSTGDALMGRLFYSFKDRYMVTFSVRRDGYSAFGLQNPHGTFPAAALSWTFTEENFLKNDMLTYGKLRLSYGENGNREVGRYAALSRMGVSKYVYQNLGGVVSQVNTLYLSNMANSDLRWERTASTNLGLDFSIKDGILGGSIDVYSATTKDLLVDRAIPSILGYSPSTVASNLGEVQNKGLEISLNSRIITKTNFNWTANLNFSMNRNKITHLYGDMVNVVDANGNITGQKEGDDLLNKWFIGHAIDEIWDPVVLGVWQKGQETEAARYGQAPGDFRLLDRDNNGKINNLDNDFQGFRAPRYIWNLRNDFNIYKNFDFSFAVYSRWGNKGEFNSAKNRDGSYPDRLNSYVTPYWTPDNPINDYARIFSSEGGAVFNIWRNKSFIRLENISLSYNVPKVLLGKVVRSLKLIGTVRNAAYYSPDWNYWDAELNNEPSSRIYTFGVILDL